MKSTLRFIQLGDRYARELQEKEGTHIITNLSAKTLNRCSNRLPSSKRIYQTRTRT